MSAITIAGGVGVVSGATGGKVYPYNNISTVPQVVAPLLPNRQKITFHNPGTVDIFIAPSQALINGVYVTLTPSVGALGGCFRVFANGGTLIIDGECQIAWQAFSASASGNPLTVMDSAL